MGAVEDFHQNLSLLNRAFIGKGVATVLDRRLLPGERIRSIHTCQWDKRGAIAVITDDRVLIEAAKTFGKGEDFPRTAITAVQAKGLTNVELRGSGIDLELSGVSDRDAFVSSLRVQASPEVAPSTGDVAGQLASLAALRESGALSDEEFTAAKQRLLGL